MTNRKTQTLILAVLIMAAAAFFLLYMNAQILTAWNLFSSDTEKEYLPVISSHTPFTATPLPTSTSTNTASPVPTATETPQMPNTATATPQPTTNVSATPTNTATATPMATATQTAVPTNTPIPGNVIVVDHNSVALFDSIPNQYITAAENINMLFIDRSVGANINDGLTCLSFSTDEEAPNHCKRFEHVDPNFSVDPSVVSWSRPGGYDRSNWAFMFWEGDCSTWFAKITCFFDMVTPLMNQYDVVSFQFSYLAVAEDSTIADQPGGYTWDNPGHEDVYDQEAFEAQHPNKTFIYWTTSLSRGIGSYESDTFNEQMRAYAINNNKILFDVADILSHDPDGNPCYDNRDGVPYDNGNHSENYPDDGLNRLAICQHYTTEVDGGHLGSVSAGKIRVAKAFWVLMARLAGWDGSVN